MIYLLLSLKTVRLRVSCTRGLVGREAKSDDEFAADFHVKVPSNAIRPFRKAVIALELKAELPNFSTSTTQVQQQTQQPKIVDHRLTISSPFETTEEFHLAVHFSSPFVVGAKLATAFAKKFVEVTLRGSSSLDEDAFGFRAAEMRLVKEQEKRGYTVIKVTQDEENDEDASSAVVVSLGEPKK